MSPSLQRGDRLSDACPAQLGIPRMLRHERKLWWWWSGCVADVHMRGGWGKSCSWCEALPPFEYVAPVQFVDGVLVVKNQWDPVRKGVASFDGAER